jgi:hypothetical protein
MDEDEFRNLLGNLKEHAEKPPRKDEEADRQSRLIKTVSDKSKS